MATGQNTQLAKQIGEHLVTAELGRIGIIASPFAGNVPDIDILAYKDGTAFPIQVKATRGGDWQFKINKFAQVSFQGKKQILGDKLANNPHLLCVFVQIDSYGKDKFFVFEWKDLADINIEKYRVMLDSKGSIRPKAHDSLHCAISPKNIEKYMVKDSETWIAKIDANIENTSKYHSQQKPWK